MQSKGPLRALTAALLVAVAGILTTLVAIAVNSATGDESDEWPGPLRMIQTDPWPSVIVLTLVGVTVAIPLWRLSSGSGDDATPGISNSAGNINQFNSSGTTQVNNYYGDVHQNAGPAPSAAPEPAEDDRDVPGLPEFVPSRSPGSRCCDRSWASRVRSRPTGRPRASSTWVARSSGDANSSPR